ncbi:hypothetical protein MSHOH_2044 [Methanosarcina horonobensis HB-1 = JCM 15518]|uniref:Mobile element protein n=1 Tax=Methanosarcina horonobensis HB-1 = JCM 15518 TaxID=1434110 RepID=A0A0E3SEC4_9EURY|nr:hypothetical protein MSHOH_2044 [Methanosarcina horonobensis HB-1 = JCM 15518]
MYKDEIGYEKGEVQKRKIVKIEIFSVDERITTISGITAIMRKKRKEFPIDFFFLLKNSLNLLFFFLAAA